MSTKEKVHLFIIHTLDSTTFLEGVVCAFLAPKLPSVVHAGLVLVLTGEPDRWGLAQTFPY